MSQQPTALPPSLIASPQITHTPSPKPPSSPTYSASSSSSSSTATDDISDSGEEGAPVIMEPSEYDFLTHGDLRSPGREFTRERSLRKKGPHQYPSDDEDKRKNLSPEERARARKKAKKIAKSEKKRALKAQEPVKNPRKREDRRREDEVAAVEASMAALQTPDDHEHNADQQNQGGNNGTSTPERQRRRSSNTLATRPAKPRKTSTSNQSGSGSSGLKSPKIGSSIAIDDTATATMPTTTNKRSLPAHSGSKRAAAFTQYNVEEGLHERAHNIDLQMAALAKMEALRETSRPGKLARGLEELEKRKMERKQNEALKDVVAAAEERYEDEKVARLYGLK
ncbi:hypothetical protein DRE_01277 [Drechslerella stenobrocha 248]|uniref:Uncharacterized protein n=1 Tax=Drechslerella stenobrocha 248 TaxID=1043628 RepID=W7I594_9PEZI|nr:hypothetical protein DRE_01277 [Drechslerella stenobrocha 248]